MDTFNIRYGKTTLQLEQSETLIGLRPKQSRVEGVAPAVRRALGRDNWRDAGVVGGFHIIAVKENGAKLDKALDQIRLDDAVAVGTHVFELPQAGGI